MLWRPAGLHASLVATNTCTSLPSALAETVAVLKLNARALASATCREMRWRWALVSRGRRGRCAGAARGRFLWAGVCLAGVVACGVAAVVAAVVPAPAEVVPALCPPPPPHPIGPASAAQPAQASVAIQPRRALIDATNG